MNVSEQIKILALAKALASAETIMVHSGDREPGSTLSTEGKDWIVCGLRLLANSESVSENPK